ncbi:hypothetical protein GSU68_09880 [Rathayibacter sp. VKM Ac-2759]|uniref:hypothetical protein n=1 Tax=Rathayibacter sp. VKM Ac-2759 TaxID=2609252 RepID=UPI001317C995|nr:hypothetical protein [Rathayibacter sp. VKM Ac-2759]QHC66837.1 hypothetical protein GSU68_09880 [Rathayibacter sp. VKM Ac-2759]
MHTAYTFMIAVANRSEDPVIGLGTWPDWLAAVATTAGFVAVAFVYRGEALRLKRDQADQVFFNVQHYSGKAHFSVENLTDKRISDAFFLMVEPALCSSRWRPVAQVHTAMPPLTRKTKEDGDEAVKSSYAPLKFGETLSHSIELKEPYAVNYGAVAFKDAHNRRWIRLFSHDECLPVSYKFFDKWSRAAEAKVNSLPEA